MANMQFIVGGAGSGKTHEIIMRLAERYRADPFARALVLVPTIRHADQFRQRLVQECGVATNLRVETVMMFSHAVTAGTPALSVSNATDELARVARRTVRRGGNAAYFTPIADASGFVSMIDAAVSSLLEDDIDPAALHTSAAQVDSQPARALADIYTAYRTELARWNVIHPLQINGVAAEIVRSGADIPDVVLVDGFLRFTADEQRLLSALAERADMTISFDPECTERSMADFEKLRQQWPSAPRMDLAAARDGSIVIKGEASNQEQHAREIARQIKQKLADEPGLKPSDCAVTFRQVMPYLTLMRRIFAEYDIPLDPAAGSRLSDSPLGVWLNRLLGIRDGGWRALDVIAVLRSGLVDPDRWRLDPSQLDHLTQTARENKLWSGVETLERLAAEAAPGFGAAVREIRQLLDNLESGAVDPVQRLADALYGDGGWLRGPQDADDETAQSIEQLRSYLDEMARPMPNGHADDDAVTESFERFRERLNRRLAMPVLVRRTPGGVLLAPMHTMHGLRFKHVMIGGLSEGEFPARRRYGDLLNDGMRRELIAAGLPLPPAPRATEEELWNSAASRATETMNLWRYRLTSAGKEASPSWVFQEAASEPLKRTDTQAVEESASERELAIACSRGWRHGLALKPTAAEGTEAPAWTAVRVAAGVEQTRRSFRFAGRHEGQVSSGLAPRLTETDGVWSASALDSYLTCAFQFFGSRVLGLRELDEEAGEADAAMRGTIVHKILEEILQPLVKEERALSQETIETVLDSLDTVGRAIWESAPEENGFGQAALWRREWQRYRDRIAWMLEQQARLEYPPEACRVLATEYGFNVEIPTTPPLTVRGKIDRIDETPDGLTILDYKTGSIPSQRMVRDGRSTQLPLYALALSLDPVGRDKNLRTAYARLPAPGAPRPWALDNTVSDDVEVITNVITILQQSRDAVDAGDFRVKPRPDDCPSFCAMKHVCRVNAYSRHKQ